MAKGNNKDYEIIPELILKDEFKEYLKALGYKNVEKDRSGVDVVAFDTTDERMKYFELKTSSTNVRTSTKYFGAMSQVEWECAFAHPDDFYVVLMWNEGKKGEKHNICYTFYQFRQLFKHISLAPYSTYLNIVFEEKEAHWEKPVDELCKNSNETIQEEWYVNHSS